MNSLFVSRPTKISLPVWMPVKVIPKIVVTKPVEPEQEESEEEEEEEEAESSNTFETVRPRIEIVKFPKKPNKFVCCWTWDVCVDNCAICRNEINNLCIECLADDFSNADPKFRYLKSGVKSRNLEVTCTVSEGTCKHVFHTHCITRWMQHRPVCPLCGRTWMSLLSSS